MDVELTEITDIKIENEFEAKDFEVKPFEEKHFEEKHFEEKRLDDKPLDDKIKTRKSKGRKIIVRKYKRPHKKISDELKQVVVDSIESGVCTRETAAAAFNLPYPTVVRIYRRFLETGITKKKKRTVFMEQKLKDEQVNFLLESLAKNCKYTLKDLTEMIYNEYGIAVSMTTIAKKISCFHYNLKRVQKINCAVVTLSVINEHRTYCDKFLQFNESGRTLIYFDKTDFDVTMRMFRGRSEEQNLLVSPSLRKRHKTILTSMSKDQILFYKAIEGPANRFSILEYIKEFYQILSKRNIEGAVIIMGNSAILSYFKEIRDITELAGHELLELPLFSPFLNPIENMFSQWETTIRAKNPKNVTELERLIVKFNDLINAEQCKLFCKDLVDIAVSCTTGDFRNE